MQATSTGKLSYPLLFLLGGNSFSAFDPSGSGGRGLWEGTVSQRKRGGSECVKYESLERDKTQVWCKDTVRQKRGVIITAYLVGGHTKTEWRGG